ncbi:MAG: MerR family transcriptional regulator [Rhizomicrobium sp.]
MAAAGALLVKSPEAFRTISEVAETLDMPQHVLRFWETRFAQIRPVKRAGGRRFYRPEDVDLLRGIRLLLYFEGYTIKGVQKILREKGVRYAAALGREDARARGHAPSPALPVAEEETDGFDALATLARVHDDAAETLATIAHRGELPRMPDRERRVRLEGLLTELTGLKARLTAARAARA